jgi:rubrerythrin/uncharacterized membrane protein
MSNWECGVCSYIHKEDNPPEKCPVCEAPVKMFSEKVENQQTEEKNSAVTGEVKLWRCKVSGYLHTGTEPPEKCPICEATAEDFEEVIEEEPETAKPEAVAERRWRCIVCGYIHTGDQPPEKCPICDAPKKMFEEIDSDGNTIGEAVAAESIPAVAISGDKGPQAVPADTGEQAAPSLFNKLGDLMLKHHLHPISVHFPNGVLPVVIVFLALSVYFNIVTLETAAYYNMIFVLVMMPVVLLTGYIEWQKRYKGIKTAIFITKIICSLVVLGSINVLVFWRLIDPGVAAEGSPSRLIYLGLAVVMLGAVGIAGHLGGKLVFGTRG